MRIPKSIVPVERVERTILLIRSQKVILDSDLSKLYGVTTKRLNQQVKRNSDRFPEDFMFQLTTKEKAEVVANCNHLSQLRFSPALPHAFTEHGAIMAASVLNTPRAIEASIFVVRAFVRLRQMLVTHKDLALKLSELERKIEKHDESIQAIFEAIRQLRRSWKRCYSDDFVLENGLLRSQDTFFGESLSLNINRIAWPGPLSPTNSPALPHQIPSLIRNPCPACPVGHTRTGVKRLPCLPRRSE